MFNKVIIGGGAALISQEDIPEVNLPQHPFTGEILPRRDAMGVEQPLRVRVIEDGPEPTPFYDEFTGSYHC